MHPVVRSDFLNCLLFLDRLQRDSRFHFRAEAPPLPRFHSCSVSEAAILHLIDWSEFWGAPHISAEWQRFKQNQQKLVDAWIEQHLREEPERYRIEHLLKTAHENAIAWTRVAESKRPLGVPNSCCARSLFKPDWTFVHRAFSDPYRFLLQRLHQIDDSCPDDSCPELQYLRGMASRHYLSILDRKATLPLTGVVLGRGSDYLLMMMLKDEWHDEPQVTIAERVAVKKFSGTADAKIDFIKASRAVRQSCEGRLDKEELRLWDDRLLEFGLSKEPHELHIKWEPPRKTDTEEPTSEEQAAFDEVYEEPETNALVEMSRSDYVQPTVFQQNDDIADTKKPSVHDAFGTQWIDYTHESHDNHPTDPSVLKREERKIFNREDAPRSPAMVADIKSHPLYEGEERNFYLTMTGQPLTTDADGKLNTIIKRHLRHDEKRDEYLSVADSGDPEFLFALKNFLHENKPPRSCLRDTP